MNYVLKFFHILLFLFQENGGKNTAILMCITESSVLAPLSGEMRRGYNNIEKNRSSELCSSDSIESITSLAFLSTLSSPSWWLFSSLVHNLFFYLISFALLSARSQQGQNYFISHCSFCWLAASLTTSHICFAESVSFMAFSVLPFWLGPCIAARPHCATVNVPSTSTTKNPYYKYTN